MMNNENAGGNLGGEQDQPAVYHKMRARRARDARIPQLLCPDARLSGTARVVQ